MYNIHLQQTSTPRGRSQTVETKTVTFWNLFQKDNPEMKVLFLSPHLVSYTTASALSEAHMLLRNHLPEWRAGWMQEIQTACQPVGSAACSQSGQTICSTKQHQVKMSVWGPGRSQRSLLTPPTMTLMLCSSRTPLVDILSLLKDT